MSADVQDRRRVAYNFSHFTYIQLSFGIYVEELTCQSGHLRISFATKGREVKLTSKDTSIESLKTMIQQLHTQVIVQSLL
jgi:hypothetical protein